MRSINTVLLRHWWVYLLQNTISYAINHEWQRQGVQRARNDTSTNQPITNGSVKACSERGTTRPQINQSRMAASRRAASEERYVHKSTNHEWQRQGVQRARNDTSTNQSITNGSVKACSERGTIRPQKAARMSSISAPRVTRNSGVWNTR